MKINVLGVQFDALEKTKILKLIEQKLDQNSKIFIVTPYSESLVEVQANNKYLQILNSADFSLADGIGVLWAAKYLAMGDRRQATGISKYIWSTCDLLISILAIIFYPKAIRRPVPEKISGSQFIWDLCALADKRGESVFFLGGFGDTAEQTSQKIKKHFPNIKIAGVDNAGGRQHSINSKKIIKKINQSSADFLFVALGPQKQETWIYENLSNLNVKLAIGLGGTFDYIAGKKASVPKFWSKIGLEWAWRLITQPKRISRIFRGVLGLIYYTCKSRLQR